MDNRPWFVAADVCRALGLQNPTMTVQSLDPDEQAKFSMGRQGEANIINESGFYHLTFKSRKEGAQEFRKWVTNEVIPSIRRSGGYIRPDASEDQLKALRKTLSRERTQNKAYKAREEVFGNRTTYGSISKITGTPRVTPVRGYLRSSKAAKDTSEGKDIIQLCLGLQEA